MENIIGAVGLENLFHAGFIGNAGDDSVGLDFRPVEVHHQPDVVLRSLRLVDQNQFRWMIDGNLSHHFRTDAACRTRYHDFLSTQETADSVHVYMDLFAWKQVLNTDFLELHVGIIVVLAPLLLTRSHVNPDAKSQKDVLQCLVITETLVLQGRNQDCLDVQLPDAVRKVIIHHKNLRSHEDTPFDGRVMCYKTLQQETARPLATDDLRQTNATVLHTVDECALSLVRIEQDIVDRLRQDAERHHADGCDKIHGCNLPAFEPHKLQVPVIDYVVHYLGNAEREQHGQCHTLQIDERRITDDARIGAEKLETYQIEYHVHEDGLAQQDNVPQGNRPVIIEPEDKDAGKITDKNVYAQYDPIRQSIDRKIPVKKFVDYLHIPFKN